jgi:hypothetical protein
VCLSDGTWKVSLPCEEIPAELPEPTLGINFARDGMRRQDWLSLVAVHSDSWLMAVAFFNGARLDAAGRRQLFTDINTLPTCFEIISGRATAPVATQQQVNIMGVARKRNAENPQGEVPLEEEMEEAKFAHQKKNQSHGGSDPCPNCGRRYRPGEFWIACDYCDRWFDGRCVGMTPQKAERSARWKCPFCADAL